MSEYDVDPNYDEHVTLEGHARDLYGHGNAAQARRPAERAIELRPWCYDARLLLARILGELDALEEELAAYDACIALAPDDPEPFAEKANSLQFAGRLEESERCARIALDLHRAYDYDAKEVPDEPSGAAMDDFGYDPNHLKAWNTRAVYDALVSVLWAQYRLEEARMVADEAIALGLSSKEFAYLDRPPLRGL